MLGHVLGNFPMLATSSQVLCSTHFRITSDVAMWSMYFCSTTPCFLMSRVYICMHQSPL